MDKYGIDQSGQDDDKVAAEGCPQCGAEIVKHGEVKICPNCGTAPWEGKKEEK